MTAPQMVYVLQATHEDGWTMPVVHGSLKSAKKTARAMWASQPDAGKLTWTTDNEGDSYTASPRDGVQFVICAEPVRP